MTDKSVSGIAAGAAAHSLLMATEGYRGNADPRVVRSRAIRIWRGRRVTAAL